MASKQQGKGMQAGSLGLQRKATAACGADCGDATTWYGIYRDEFVRLMAFGDHETMDHPVACQSDGQTAT